MLLILPSINISSQQSASEKFQKKFNKLNVEDLDAFLVKNGFLKNENTSIERILNIEVSISSYYDKENDELLTLIVCNNDGYYFPFVGQYVIDSLGNKNIEDTRGHFNYEYVYCKNKNNDYSSFLIKNKNNL